MFFLIQFVNSLELASSIEELRCMHCGQRMQRRRLRRSVVYLRRVHVRRPLQQWCDVFSRDAPMQREEHPYRRRRHFLHRFFDIYEQKQLAGRLVRIACPRHSAASPSLNAANQIAYVDAEFMLSIKRLSFS